MGSFFHDGPGNRNGVLDVLDASDTARFRSRAIHDAGIELHLAVGCWFSTRSYRGIGSVCFSQSNPLFNGIQKGAPFVVSPQGGLVGGLPKIPGRNKNRFFGCNKAAGLCLGGLMGHHGTSCDCQDAGGKKSTS